MRTVLMSFEDEYVIVWLVYLLPFSFISYSVFHALLVRLVSSDLCSHRLTRSSLHVPCAAGVV